jgi:DNA repair exonuclease SbcCD ATPase subunit
MRKFTQDLERAKIENKMATARKLLEDKQLNSALQAERDLQAVLEQMHEQFTKMRGALAESDEEKLDLALDQTRKLRENLESLEREIQELKRSQTASGQNVQAGPDESRQAPQQLDPSKIDWWNNELAKSQKELELIQEALQADTSLARQFGRIHQKFRGLVRNFAGGSAERMKLIEAQVLNPLRGFEAELAQKLELLKNKEKLFLAREEKIPAEYEELVKKYYEALSKTK